MAFDFQLEHDSCCPDSPNILLGPTMSLAICASLEKSEKIREIIFLHSFYGCQGHITLPKDFQGSGRLETERH